MADYLIQGDTLTGIADAIRGKTGKSDQIQTANMASEIQSIQAGRKSVSEKDVNFYDYDGTLVDSYTLEEVKSLTSLPDAPVHEGLTFQEWNWTLDDVKSLTTPMNVGANYVTSDGKTRLYLNITPQIFANYASPTLDITMRIYQSPASGFTVSWGDGQQSDSGTSEIQVSLQHSYTEPGEYVVEITPNSGAQLDLAFDGDGLIGVAGSTDNHILTAVELGERIRIVGYSFVRCYALKTVSVTSGIGHAFSAQSFARCFNLEAVVVPKGVDTIATSCFNFNQSLQTVCLPNSVTSMGNYVFQNSGLRSIGIPDGLVSFGTGDFSGCNRKQDVVIPDGTTEIPQSFSQNNYCIPVVVIPATVTTIGSSAFISCSSLYCVICLAQTPPALQSANAFDKIFSDAYFYVPRDAVDTYKQATNWATYADKIRAIEDYPEITGGAA